MADDPIRDDHPEFPPRPAPKPEAEPIVIEGEASEPTLHEGEPNPLESSDEPVADELLLAERERHLASDVEPEAFSEPIGSPGAFEPWAPVVEASPEPEAAPKPPEPELAFAPPPPPDAPPRSGFGSGLRYVGYALAIIVIIVVALFVGALIHNPFSDAMTATEQRLGAVEAALGSETAARIALEARVTATQAKLGQPPASTQLDGLDARVAKLEAAATVAQASPAPAAPTAEPAPVTASAPPSSTPVDGTLADRVAKLETALTAPAPANPEIAKLAGGQSSLDNRIAKLETALAAPTPAKPEIAKLASGESSLDDRIVKLEAALATQKSEARAAPLALARGLDPVAEAVAAISLSQRLSAGEPYAAELAALGKAGADAGALAALKPYADTGAPTPAKLGHAFDELGPSLGTSVKPEANGKVVDKMMDQLRGLVKVRVVGEIQGEDPAALISQISAALARGDVAAALATEAKLPESARAVTAGWVKDAEGLEAATAAARSLAETALRRFADAKN